VEDRQRGLALRRALLAARLAKTPDQAETLMREELAKDEITDPDYAVVRDVQTLQPSATGPWRALITARVGSVRLLDNLSWTPSA
jgi:pantothenate synthetase